MKKQAKMIQKVLTIEIPVADIAHLPEDARTLLTQLQPHIRHSVIYDGVLYPASDYFAHLITLLGQNDTYEEALTELKKQDGRIATMDDKEQPNGPVTPKEYLSRLATLARSSNSAKVQAGKDEMLRYLGWSEEERFDAWFQSIAQQTNSEH